MEVADGLLPPLDPRNREQLTNLLLLLKAGRQAALHILSGEGTTPPPRAAGPGATPPQLTVPQPGIRSAQKERRLWNSLSIWIGIRPARQPPAHSGPSLGLRSLREDGAEVLVLSGGRQSCSRDKPLKGWRVHSEGAPPSLRLSPPSSPSPESPLPTSPGMMQVGRGPPIHNPPGPCTLRPKVSP